MLRVKLYKDILLYSVRFYNYFRKFGKVEKFDIWRYSGYIIEIQVIFWFLLDFWFEIYVIFFIQGIMMYVQNRVFYFNKI